MLTRHKRRKKRIKPVLPHKYTGKTKEEFRDFYYTHGREWEDNEMICADIKAELPAPGVTQQPFHFRNVKHTAPDLPTPSEMQEIRLLIQERNDAQIEWQNEKQLLLKQVAQLKSNKIEVVE